MLSSKAWLLLSFFKSFILSPPVPWTVLQCLTILVKFLWQIGHHTFFLLQSSLRFCLAPTTGVAGFAGLVAEGLGSDRLASESDGEYSEPELDPFSEFESVCTFWVDEGIGGGLGLGLGLSFWSTLVGWLVQGF